MEERSNEVYDGVSRTSSRQSEDMQFHLDGMQSVPAALAGPLGRRVHQLRLRSVNLSAAT